MDAIGRLQAPGCMVKQGPWICIKRTVSSIDTMAWMSSATLSWVSTTQNLVDFVQPMCHVVSDRTERKNRHGYGLSFGI